MNHRMKSHTLTAKPQGFVPQPDDWHFVDTALVLRLAVVFLINFLAVEFPFSIVLCIRRLLVEVFSGFHVCFS